MERIETDCFLKKISIIARDAQPRTSAQFNPHKTLHNILITCICSEITVFQLKEKQILKCCYISTDNPPLKNVDRAYLDFDRTGSPSPR